MGLTLRTRFNIVTIFPGKGILVIYANAYIFDIVSFV